MANKLIEPKKYSKVYYTVNSNYRRQINAKSKVLGIDLIDIDEVFAKWENEKPLVTKRVYPEALDATRRKMNKELLNKFMEAGVKSFSSNREMFTWITGLAFTGWIVDTDVKILEEQIESKKPKERYICPHLNKRG